MIISIRDYNKLVNIEIDEAFLKTLVSCNMIITHLFTPIFNSIDT